MGGNFTKTGLILIYPGYQNEAKQYQYGRIIEEFNKLGITIEKLKVDEIIFAIQNNESNRDVSKYDFCIQLVKDKYINTLLEKAGIPSFNKYTAIENTDDKMMSYTILANKGIAMPMTISGVTNTGIEKIDSVSISKELEDYIEQKLGYPLIIKKSNSKGGRDIYKANNQKELEQICKSLDNKGYLFQEFVKDNIGKDIRVLVIGGKTIGAFMRSNENDFRSNISLGGKALPYEIETAYSETAEKVAKLLKLDYGSVDFFMTKDKKPLLCEVNSDPAIIDFEQLLNKNIAEIFAKHVVKQVYAMG